MGSFHKASTLSLCFASVLFVLLFTLCVQLNIDHPFEIRSYSIRSVECLFFDSIWIEIFDQLSFACVHTHSSLSCLYFAFCFIGLNIRFNLTKISSVPCEAYASNLSVVGQIQYTMKIDFGRKMTVLNLVCLILLSLLTILKCAIFLWFYSLGLFTLLSHCRSKCDSI